MTVIQADVSLQTYLRKLLTTDNSEILIALDFKVTVTYYVNHKKILVIVL